MSYDKRMADEYDRIEQFQEESTERALRKLNYEFDDIVRDYSDYFSKDEIKVLIFFLLKKDKSDKKKSDVENILYDLDMLSIKFSEYIDEPLYDMLERLEQ
ncbi:Uncharacterised protein [Campylobacter hyointestinalis subsp. hyointestinalis]|uniref:Uncharacterized protein n=1 Tax=Campylobacter hyointestinalis subsp. hyointestinalis TaxID=91352 RepID=A0A9W5AWX1_CAMHY|nr:hypothetical protein [Campylobacter hyointestinalis]CUU92476.1 Uncharacterised protein [Campylobacter hyointestinalis subsp. hyointestinalis]